MKKVISDIATGLLFVFSVLLLIYIAGLQTAKANEQAVMLGFAYTFSSTGHHEVDHRCQTHAQPQTFGVHAAYKWSAINDNGKKNTTELGGIKRFGNTTTAVGCDLSSWSGYATYGYPHESEDGRYVEAAAGFIISQTDWRATQRYHGIHIGPVINLTLGTGGDVGAYAKVLIEAFGHANHSKYQFVTGVESKTRKHDYDKDRTPVRVVTEVVQGPPGPPGEDGRDGVDGDDGVCEYCDYEEPEEEWCPEDDYY